MGLIIAIWSVKTLTLHDTVGIKGKLSKKGPYKYSRHPQYVGYISMLIGLIIYTHTLQVLIISILAILWYILATYTEEPWLEKNYNYKAYKKQTPRFL